MALLIGGGPSCPDWGCGTNSPTVGDGVVFDELDSVMGVGVGPHHIAIVSAILDSRPVRLRVDRHELVAIPASGPELRGPALTNLVITLSGDLGRYELKIEEVKQDGLNFWAGDLGETVPFYRILTQALGTSGSQTSICKPGISALEKIWTSVDGFAMVFAGDHYDARNKTVADLDPRTTLFNLACAGAAPAKMHLMRHTNAGAWTTDHHLVDGHAPFATSLQERQAMLKMFAADYCGTGHPYTIDGQPLEYGDSRSWYPLTPMTARLDPPSGFVATIESLWNENGAVCLDTPRLVARDDIPCARALPPCHVPGEVRWEDRAHVISANASCPAAR
jgi:hypothetical protein